MRIAEFSHWRWRLIMSFSLVASPALLDDWDISDSYKTPSHVLNGLEGVHGLRTTAQRSSRKGNITRGMKWLLSSNRIVRPM